MRPYAGRPYAGRPYAGHPYAGHPEIPANEMDSTLPTTAS